MKTGSETVPIPDMGYPDSPFQSARRTPSFAADSKIRLSPELCSSTGVASFPSLGHEIAIT